MRQLHIYVSKDMNIRGYFSKPNAVREKKKVWETLVYCSTNISCCTGHRPVLPLCRKSAAYVNALYPAYCVASYWNGRYRSLDAIAAQSRNYLFAINTTIQLKNITYIRQ